MSGEAELSSGQALIAEGRFAEAAIHLEAAAGGFASIGSLREESHAAWLASVALRQTGDVNAARRFLQRSAEVLRREADQRVRVRVWMPCANDLAELDGTAAGLGWWGMAASAADLLDDPQLISEAEQAYAEALIVTGAADKALPHVERASEAAIRANETQRATQVLHRSAELLSRQGRPREGIKLARQAWQATRGIHDPALKVSVAVAIGDFLRVHEQFEEAQTILNEEQNIADETGDGSLRATARLVQGQLLVELGRINEGSVAKIAIRVLSLPHALSTDLIRFLHEASLLAFQVATLRSGCHPALRQMVLPLPAFLSRC
jgi:tetratricopeptide (TPR) repeat protein